MKKGYLAVAVAALVAALFVIPGLAFGGKGGGGGTPNPPPTNPPCDSDHHLSIPSFLHKHHQCNGGQTTGKTTGKSTTKGTTNPPCDRDHHALRLPPGLRKKCPPPSTTTTSPSPSPSPGEDACETDGILGSNKGLGLSSSNETVGDIAADHVLPNILKDPEVPPDPNAGPLSGGLYTFLAPISPPVAAEAACAVNTLGL